MGEWRPPHAYIPGQTSRHPEDLFDDIKASTKGLSCDQLQNCTAWHCGLCFLKEGFFWEAHEVLEAVWMVCPPNSAEKLMVQAVIQCANSKLKHLMGRPAAAHRLEIEATRLADEAVRRAHGSVMGLGSEIMH